jgi:hypothetical protein
VKNKLRVIAVSVAVLSVVLVVVMLALPEPAPEVSVRFTGYETNGKALFLITNTSARQVLNFGLHQQTITADGSWDGEPYKFSGRFWGLSPHQSVAAGLEPPATALAWRACFHYVPPANSADRVRYYLEKSRLFKPQWRYLTVTSETLTNSPPSPKQ